MALFRLLERQGILRGDLNIVQQLALQKVMAYELDDLAEMESYKIKTQLMIAHPELAKDIFEENEEEAFEELEQLDPDDPNASFSQDTVDEMLNSLKDFGFYVSDTDG